MLGFILKKIFGTKYEKDIKQLEPLVEEISALESDIAKLTLKIVELIEDEDGDALLKCAALHAAAEVFNQTVMNQSLLAVIQRDLQADPG